MSQVNHNASYLYDVDGLTVWERLRVVRNFLTDRRQALALANLELEKKEAKMASLSEDSFEYREMLIFKPQSIDLIDDCEREIKFLEDFESRLLEEAEKTRIPGKTDKEMYELNFFEEHKRRIVLDVQSEVAISGGIGPQTMKALLRNREAMIDVIRLGLLKPNILQLPNIISSNSKETLKLMGAPVTEVPEESANLIDTPTIQSSDVAELGSYTIS